MAIKICCYGSCVTRDIFSFLSQADYDVVQTIGRTPISLCRSTPTDPPEDFIQNKLQTSGFYRKTIKNQFLSSTIKDILDCHADYIVMDLAEERLSRYTITYNNKKVCLTDFFPSWCKLFLKYIQNNNLTKDFEDLVIQHDPVAQYPPSTFWEDYKYWVKSIIKSPDNPNGYEEKQIILVEAYLTAKYFDKSGQLSNYNKSKYNVEKINQYLKQFYDMFVELVPNCHRIRIPAFSYGALYHCWGPHPLHFTDDIYQYFADAINIITGVANNHYTLAKLYGKKSIQNRMKARVANSYPFYQYGKKISQLEKALKEANDRIDELSKRMENQ